MQSLPWQWRRRSAFVYLTCLLIVALTLPAQAQDNAADNPPDSGAYKVYLPMLVSQGSATTAVDASAAAQSSAAAIHLRTATFAPGQGQAPVLPPGLTVAGYQQGQRGYYLVQFAGPVQQAWKDAVTAAGADLLDYIPDFAFKVRMNPAQAAQVAQLANVTWVGPFQPAYKLSPELLRDGVHLYQVRIEQGADAGLTTAAIAQSGAEIVSRTDGILLVAADANQLQAIAHVLDVAWVENFVMPEKHGDFGAGVILGSTTVNANGYNGSSQIAAVADTGLGTGAAAGAHPDIPASRIQAIYNWPGVTDSCFRTITDDGAQDVDSGHGTHVAVSVLGDGDASGRGIGTAPAAKLVFQATENWVTTSNLCKLYGYPDDYYLTGLPADLRTLYQQAYAAGARIHANSWGSAQAGLYTINSVNTDDFIWTNRDMLITFSAGNEGIDTNADGIVDNDSIGAPATAKNVLTVGASENQRTDNYPCDTTLTHQSRDAYQPSTTCSGMSGQNILGTYGVRWPADYPAPPLSTDPTAGNMEQMAAFSSRGPTDDGRIKPDVVAPGTWILAGYSSLYQEGYGDPLNPRSNRYQMDGWGMPLSADYKYFGGTSMSNPLAAGAATVVRDFYQKAKSINASAALVKATLINSAVDLGDENNDGVNDNDYPIPNSHEGWGRINLINATDNSAFFTDQTSGLATGGSIAYQFNVAGGAPFKATLVWSDYRSTEAAAKNLVNDLDVVVTGPGGVQYRGNVFSGGWSAVGGTADRTNNVENVYVQSAAAGTWTVSISGFNVPNGPQPFALVVDGGAYITPPTVYMHVGDLDGAKSTASAGKWNATVTITVHDAGHATVAGATITGAWSGGATGSASCTTNGSGICSVSKTNIAKTAASVTFTVSGVTHASYTYQASSNHDPETDSNGTAITITKP